MSHIAESAAESAIEPVALTADGLADITIIGAGPTGLYAAFYAGLRTMKVRLVDSMAGIGGQLTALYPKKMIFDVAGFPKVLAEELVQSLYEQALQYHPDVQTGAKVETVEHKNGVIELNCSDGRKFLTKTVLIAAGVGAFMPRKLELADAAEREDKGLFYFVRDPKVFHGKRILIIGGGDSAMDWAMALSGNADLTLIHRRDKFTAHEDSVQKVMTSDVRVKPFYELRQIIGNGDARVKQAVIFNNRTSETETLDVDAILCNLGFLTNLGPIKNWGVEIVNNAVMVDINMATTVKGIYAAGDIVWHPAKLKLIATGFGEAAIAVNNAKIYTDPNASFFPGHSSTAAEKKDAEKKDKGHKEKASA